jgi:acyl-CoA thioesterase I
MDFQLPFSHTLITEFRSIFKKLADQNDMTYIPFFLEGVMGQKHLNLIDGLHPSAKGYEIMAERIWPVLSPLLQ